MEAFILLHGTAFLLFEFYNMITRIDSATSKSNGKILGSSQIIRIGIGGFNLAVNDNK